jgi:hypothetical protein
MNVRLIYPDAPWPLAQVHKHPCVRMLVTAANDPANKSKRSSLFALIAVLQKVEKNHAAYENGILLNDLINSIHDMPESYDEAWLIDQLKRMRLFTVEFRDFDLFLVPATSAAAKPDKVARVTVGGTVPPDVRERAIAAATAAGKTLSAWIADLIEQNV